MSMPPNTPERSFARAAPLRTPTLIESAIAKSAGRVENLFLAGNRRVFQRRREGNRHVHRADALHRAVEIVKGAFGDHRSDFGGYAVALVAFVDDDSARSFFDR